MSQVRCFLYGDTAPMLHLIADRLSQTNVVEKFWDRRLQRLIDSASYHPCQQAA